MTLTHDKFDWTPRRLDMLRNLVADKLAFPEIAARLGTSKGSALGKAQRLGLTECTAETLSGGRSRVGNHTKRVRDEMMSAPRADRDGNAAKGRIVNNPGGIRMAQQSRAASQNAPHKNGFTGFPSLKQGATVAAIAGSAESEARKRAAREAPETNGTMPVDTVLLDCAPISPVDTGLRNVAFPDLPANGCKWATTPHHVVPADHRFCAAPRASGEPWCELHAGKARGVASGSLSGLGSIDNWSAAARVKEGA